MKTGRRERLFLTLLLIALTAALTGCAGGKSRRLARQQYDQALLIRQSGRTDQAIDALKRSTLADPAFIPAHTMLADIYKQRGDYARAGERYETLTRLEPKAARHFSDLGLMQHLLGRLEQAAGSYLRSLQLRPADSAANINLGLVYLSLGNSRQSLVYLGRATSIEPRSIVAWTNYAVALDAAGELKAAEKAYRKALELHGDQSPVLINYGGNLIQQGRPDDAINALQQAIAINDSALPNKLMGDALALKGWPDAAVGRYERATRIDPAYWKAHNALGDALIASYEKGLQLEEPLRERAVTAWRTSLLKKPNQLAVIDKVRKWER